MEPRVIGKPGWEDSIWTRWSLEVLCAPTENCCACVLGSLVKVFKYMNIMMSNMIFKHMSSVFDSNTSLTGGNILKLLAIMSLWLMEHH